MSWKYFYSSVKGTSHEVNNLPKQDNCRACVMFINGKNYLISIVADGAGSAKYSDLSSNFICKYFIKKTQKWLESNSIETLTKNMFCNWFKDFQAILNRAVKLYKLDSIRDFATTLLYALIGDKYNIFVQIGDGIIVIQDDADLDCVFKPQNGEFINTTHFATEQNAINLFMYKNTSLPIKKLAMHTDGIEQIAFDFSLQKPFTPFFTPFFKSLEKSSDCIYNEELSKQLELFLQSDRVNKKTDDDKTLFVAIQAKPLNCDNNIENEMEDINV